MVTRGVCLSLLCVPKTSSRSCDQAIFVDQATDAGLFSDVVLLKIDRFGQRCQRRSAVQGAVRPVLIMVWGSTIRCGLAWAVLRAGIIAE
jgi:hypothetical protein